jgi:hypothetical protein
MSKKPPLDPYIEAQIERTLRPYLGVAPPALLQTMREELELALRTHPVAAGLVGALRDRGAPLASAEVPREGADSNGDGTNENDDQAGKPGRR